MIIHFGGGRKGFKSIRFFLVTLSNEDLSYKYTEV